MVEKEILKFTPNNGNEKEAKEDERVRMREKEGT